MGRFIPAPVRVASSFSAMQDVRFRTSTGNGSIVSPASEMRPSEMNLELESRAAPVTH